MNKPDPQIVIHVESGNPVAAAKQREWLRKVMAQATPPKPSNTPDKKAG